MAPPPPHPANTEVRAGPGGPARCPQAATQPPPISRPLPPRRARLPGRQDFGQILFPEPCCLAAMGQGREVGDRRVAWAQQGPAGCRAVPQAAAASQLLARPSLCPLDPAGYQPALGTAPRPGRELGAAHVPGCVSHRPGRHQAGGGRRSTSSSKSMCRQGVMGPSWRLFLGNRSQRMGNPLSLPPRPSQPPPPGLRGDPHQPAPPQGHAASYGGAVGGGGGRMPNRSRAGGRGDGCC